MATDTLWVFLVFAFAAEVIGTMAGFGAATILTPVASFFMDIKTAVAVVACFHLFGNASRLYFFGRHIRWKVVAQFGIPGVACSFVGAKAAAWLPAHQVRIILGGFLIVYAALETLRLAQAHLPAPRTEVTPTSSHLKARQAGVPATPATLLLGGVASGGVAGLIGTGGAIRSVCLLAFGLPKESYLGTSALIALIVDATRLPVYVTQQFIPPTLLPMLVVLIGVAFCGAWLGQRLVRRVSPVGFKRFVLVMLVAMGVKLLVDGLRGL